MIKRRSALFIVMAGLLAGCVMSGPGRLYPVEGALATQVPVPVFSFTATSPGAVTVTTDQVYKGSRTTQNPADPAGGVLEAEWDRVYGPGFFVANVLGNVNVWHFTLTGAQGGSMEIEMFVGGDVTAVYFHRGVARDDKGGVFKLVF